MADPCKPRDAAQWFAKVEGGRLSHDEQRAFADWLEAPGNAQAYGAMEHSWQALGAAGGDRELLRMRSAALRAASGPSRRAIFGMAGGAAAAAAAAGGVGLMMAGAAQATIRTGRGERLTATLPDGSRVTLAPLSTLRAASGGARRTARLDEGQAYFEIGAAAGKPFRVLAGGRVVESLGGRFQVSIEGGRAEILLEEGALRVAPEAGGGGRIVRAGQILTGPVQTPAVCAADAETLTAWRTGRLVFDDEALGRVVASFNRYSRDQLVLAQPELAAIRISGSFRYDGAREFAQAMQAAFGLRVRQAGASTWAIEAAQDSERPAFAP